MLRAVKTTSRIRALSPRYRRIAREARELYSLWASLPAPADDSVHPLWIESRPSFAELVEQGVPPDFLNREIVRHLLYRTGFGELERAQLAYLDANDGELLRFGQTYEEPWVGTPCRDCAPLGSSVAVLNKLYNVARLQSCGPQPSAPTYIEFGGGYGLLCHLVRELLGRSVTYVIVDLPELLALQYVVLRASSRMPVKGHVEPPSHVEAGATNLVPSALLPDLDLTCDVFLSTFALSETPQSVQRFVADKNFFGASRLYLVGQNIDDELWSPYGFEDMSYVHDAASRIFRQVRLEPFPVVDAWELTAWDPRSPSSVDLGHDENPG